MTFSHDDDLEANKKKLLDDQETEYNADKESSEPLVLTDELKAEGIEMISYSKKYLYIEDYNGHSVHVNLFKDSISRTLEYFDSLVDGEFNDSLKKSIKLFLYQSWENIGTKSKTKTDDQEPTDKQKRKRPINKFSGNGRLELHESVVIGVEPQFVTVKNEKEFKFKNSLENGPETLVPNGTIYTASPLSYVFKNEEKFQKYLTLAKGETLDSLMIEVDTIIRKYLNVEEHYYTLIAADIIFSFFQDKFPYTHYLIFLGDNGSGKNSALLVFKYLGYRVFYVVSASAANYFTVLGSREEGQVCTAEDEVEDIGEKHNQEKRNLLKSGYCKGASVPKTELEGGRSQENWLVYCHKWLAMEELKEDKYTKGIIHRSFKLNMVAGDVPYNIKDVTETAGDPIYDELQKELNDLRNKLFCFRLLHFKDRILNVELNVKGRTAELAKPLIRLFQDSPIALQKILNSLSMFIQERNESNTNSFEAKLYQSIESLINDRMTRTLNPTEQDTILGPYLFTNQSIKEKLIEVSEATEDSEKKGMYYSPEIGGFSESKIKTILKSKFKVDRTRVYINGKTVRCVKFKEEYLNRIKATYSIPKKIMIVKPKSESKSSDATDATDAKYEYKGDLEENSTTENLDNSRKHGKNDRKIPSDPNNLYENRTLDPSEDTSKDLVSINLPSEPSVASETEQPKECPDCHRMIKPFDKNTHLACCQGSGPSI